MSELRVAVVCGGPSAEAEVSRSSGKGVATALRETYRNVAVIELDAGLYDALRSFEVDVVFPVMHGSPGEDGTLQGFCEILRIPYVGSGVLASACALNKVVAKQVFRGRGLPVAPDVVVARTEGAAEGASRVLDVLGPRTVVKPASQGSAIGVSFATDRDTLEHALRSAFEFDDEVLVEQCVDGREITVALLERDEGLEAFPVVEVRTPEGTWYDYEHRYTPGYSEHLIPAPLPEEMLERITEVAKRAHTGLGCRDLSRVDFVVPEQGDPVVLEVNTLPGMTPTSLYPDAARAAGIEFAHLVAYLADRAHRRGP